MNPSLLSGISRTGSEKNKLILTLITPFTLGEEIECCPTHDLLLEAPDGWDGRRTET